MTNAEKREICLEVMAHLKSAHEDALVCYYAYNDDPLCEHKFDSFIKRMKTINSKMENVKNDK